MADPKKRGLTAAEKKSLGRASLVGFLLGGGAFALLSVGMKTRGRGPAGDGPAVPVERGPVRESVARVALGVVAGLPLLLALATDLPVVSGGLFWRRWLSSGSTYGKPTWN